MTNSQLNFQLSTKYETIRLIAIMGGGNRDWAFSHRERQERILAQEDPIDH